MFFTLGLITTTGVRFIDGEIVLLAFNSTIVFCFSRFLWAHICTLNFVLSVWITNLYYVFESQICITCSNHTFVSPWHNRTGWLGIKHQFTYRHLHYVFQAYICITCCNATCPCVFASICLLTFQTHPARSLWHWTVTKATRWFMTPREWRLTVLPAMADAHPQWGWLAEPTGRRCTASCPPWRTVCWRGVRTAVCMSVQPAMAWGPRRSASPPVSLCNVSVRKEYRSGCTCMSSFSFHCWGGGGGGMRCLVERMDSWTWL